MRELTEEQKKKCYIYKETTEYSFPEDRVWKLWIPLPDTYNGGVWMQFPSRDEALDMALMPDRARRDYLGRIFYEGGW